MNKNKIEINGETYIRESSLNSDKLKDTKGLTLCILRTYSAGVWYGYVNYEGDNTFSNVIVKMARRIYSWAGAFTLSGVALHGIGDSSKIAETLPEIQLNRVIELIPVSDEAKNKFDKIKHYEV